MVRKLKSKLKAVTQELAVLNVELAEQMVFLAAQTGDSAPLIGAVEALRKAEDIYSLKSMPRRKAAVQKSLGDTLLSLGREHNDFAALEAAVQAYRSAITLASLLGDEVLRQELKHNYASARRLLAAHDAAHEESKALRGAAA